MRYSAFHASPLRGEAGRSPDEGGYKYIKT